MTAFLEFANHADIVLARGSATVSALSPGCAVLTHEFKGAASRVAAEATAFGLRRDHVLFEIIAAYVDRSDKIEEQQHQAWARTARHAFDTTALPGGYPNLLAPGEPERVMKSYGPNVERLIEAKWNYDPDNVFRSAIPLPASINRPTSPNPRFAGAAANSSAGRAEAG